MGIDHGDHRMGIAVSDAGGTIAFPKKVILKSPGTFKEIREFAEAESVSKIVIGLPLGSDGGDTEQARQVREFAQALHREIMLPVEFENELLTTHLVEKAGIKREHADAAAAALILQSYLDRKSQVPNRKSQTNSND